MSFENLLNKIDDSSTLSPQKQEETIIEDIYAMEPSINIQELDDSQRTLMEKAKNEINLQDSNSVSFFGSGVQREIAQFADGILAGVKTKDTEYVGTNLTELLFTIKGVKIDDLGKKEKPSFFKKLLSRAEKKMITLQEVSKTVDTIVVSLDTARQELIKDVNVLDVLYQKNIDYLRSLEAYIAAGEERHRELSQTTLQTLKNKAHQTQSVIDAQNYNYFVQFLTEIEKRIYDLKISKEIALQTLPQIRLMQSNDKVLANKIQSSILTTIPIWKNQIALTISLNKQKSALEIQQKVSETTNDMLKKNAELLKTNTIAIAKESERSIVSIETLRETQQKLLSTIDESMKIFEEGREKRKRVEQELIQMENTQKNKLLEYRDGHKR